MFVQLEMYPVEAIVSSGSWNRLDLIDNVPVLLFGLLFQRIVHFGFSKPFAEMKIFEKRREELGENLLNSL